MTIDGEGTRLLFELTWWVGGAGVVAGRGCRKLVAVDRHLDLALRFGRWCEREAQRWDAAMEITGLDLVAWIRDVIEIASLDGYPREAIALAETWSRIEGLTLAFWGEKLRCLARAAEREAVHAEIAAMRERLPDAPEVALLGAMALRDLFEPGAALDEARRGLALTEHGDRWRDEFEALLADLLEEGEAPRSA